MKTVTFTFVGQDSDEMAQKFYTYVVDGGLEDQIVDTLTEQGPSEVEMIEINNDELNIVMGCKYKRE